MINIIFRNLEKSELAKEIVNERLQVLLDKFPELNEHALSVTLSMQNSPLQSGPDFFTVKVFINGSKFMNLSIEKSAPNLYLSLAEVCDHLLELLNRNGDKKRVRSRKKERQFRVFRRAIV